jgi:tetratricopeptide (TPR) repeat protein
MGAGVEARDSDTAVREVTAALAGSRLDEAIAIACRALDDGFETPLFLNLRAYRMEREGRDGEALSDLQRAYALAPRDIAVLNALGLCLARLGQLRGAVEAFQSAIRVAPDFAPAHYNKGWALEDLGEIEAAQKSYELAATHAANPADAQGRLAALAARRSDWAETRRLADRALATDAGNPHANLALASAELGERAYAAAEARLRTLLGRAEVGGLERARTNAMLGDALDAQDRPADAFAAYSRANEEMHQSYAAKYTGPETVPQYLAWLSSYFRHSRPEQWATQPGEAVASPAARHVFLLGFPRSGTTLLEEALACHPDIVTASERDALGPGIAEYMASPAALDRLASAQSRALEPFRAAYWDYVRGLGIDVAGKTFIDKQPYNTVNLPLISRLFPSAKILFAIRDPRDVVLGCFRQLFRMNRYNFEFLTLEGTARLYDGTMRLAELYRAKLPLDLFETRHEDLVDDFEGHTRAICDFIGVAWVPAMHDFARKSTKRGIATPSAPQLAQGLNRAGLGRWRRYETELAPILPVLKPWAERLGYPGA